MVFLFDANVLIAASNTYYPIDRIPEFWSWIAHQATSGKIQLPIEILEEVLAGRKNDDPLLDWIKAHYDSLELNEASVPEKVQHVLEYGYATDLTDVELEVIGRDPFLIAYAFADGDRCVVTAEVSSPKKKRQNRKVPDVCTTVGVKCCNPFEAYGTLGFSTAWKK